ncbi:MAG: hypothetical protein ACTSVI_13935 [Promethearchaeota archaeon]
MLDNGKIAIFNSNVHEFGIIRVNMTNSIIIVHEHLCTIIKISHFVIETGV